MAEAPEIDYLDLDYDVLALDLDIDYVVLDGQLELVHRKAREQNFGRACRLEELDFSFRALGVEEPQALHNFLLDTIIEYGHELPLVDGFLETVEEIHQEAEDAEKLVVINALSSRSSLLTEATMTHVNRLAPGVFNNFNLTGNVDPIPPILPKWSHHRHSGEDLAALGFKVVRAIADDMPSAADQCVNKAGGNLGMVFGNHPWNRGKLPVVQPGPGAEQRRIVRTIDHHALGRAVVGTFFRNVD